MRTSPILISIFLFVLVLSCSKDEGKRLSCSYLHSAGAISGIAGPDSVRVNEQQALTVDVSAPSLCVADIRVIVTPYNDTLYYLDADVKYIADSSKICNCEVSDHHYVRVYFTVPAAGTIALSAPQGIGQSPSHIIKVY